VKGRRPGGGGAGCVAFGKRFSEWKVVAKLLSRLRCRLKLSEVNGNQ
jgi:hypothetical protein